MTTRERIDLLGSHAHLFEAFTGSFAADDLLEWIRAELGSRDALDEPLPYGPAIRSVVRVPELLLHVVSENTPHAAFQSLLRGLVLGSRNLIKLPSSGLEEFESALTKLPGPLQNLVTCSRELPPDWTTRPDLAIVFGSDETLSWFASHAPATLRLVTHGQRLSAALVRGEAATAARRAAHDVSLFDQRGCLSIHDVYVSSSADVSPPEFAALLAEEMERFNREHPRAPLSLSDAGAITNLRETARFVAASQPDEIALWESTDSTDWTVIYESDPVLKVSPLNRVVFVKPWPTPSNRITLGPASRHLATLALHPYDDETATALTALGATRICPLGETQAPSLFWHHDGLPPLASLVTWVDLDR